ncbi:MAG: hypothetical protein ACOYJX_00430 [Acutalibacteraceae bacterium]|jgi:hypothetical protein
MKKISLIFLALLIMLLPLGGCGKAPATVPATKEESEARFAACKKEIEAILEKENVNYELEEVKLGNEIIPANIMPGIMMLKITLTDKPGDEISIALTNKGESENFIITLKTVSPSIDECSLKIRQYPYLKDVFSLLSGTRFSIFSADFFMWRARRGIEKEYEKHPAAFDKKEEKYLYRDKSNDLKMTYSIYYNSVAEPAVFEETFDFSGKLAPVSIN